MTERQLLAAVRKWLRQHGFRADGRNRDMRLWIRYGVDLYPYPWIQVDQITQYGSLAGSLVEARVESARQAVDILVVIGVLPVQFASWTPVECDLWDPNALISAMTG